MNSGRLRYQVTIQSITESQDTIGQPVKTWGTHATVWAEIAPFSGRETFSAQQVKPELTHTVTVRYLSTITPGMRVLYGSRYLNIEAVVDPKERHKEMQLLCKEVV